jgi:hypothetical protein
VRDPVAEHLGQPDAVVVIDDTGFLKKDQVGGGAAAVFRNGRAHGELSDRGVRRLRARHWARVIDRNLYVPQSC